MKGDLNNAIYANPSKYTNRAADECCIVCNWRMMGWVRKLQLYSWHYSDYLDSRWNTAFYNWFILFSLSAGTTSLQRLDRCSNKTHSIRGRCHALTLGIIITTGWIAWKRSKKNVPNVCVVYLKWPVTSFVVFTCDAFYRQSQAWCSLNCLYWGS